MNFNYITISLFILMPLIISILLFFQSRLISKRIIKASITMIIQLSISVVLLMFVFKSDNILLTILFMLVMMLFSFKTINKNTDKTYNYKAQAKISTIIASVVTIIYLIFILNFSVEAISPRYIIPLFGMLLGNTNTATILASNEIHNILVNNKDKIHTLIYLGVPEKTALNEQLKTFIVVAITPTIASMLNIGVVSLPGMMSGQILAGEIPTQAVLYQMMIMFGILSSITMSLLILKHLIIKKVITNENKLHIDLIN